VKPGQKIKFLGREAIFLLERNHEVLVQIDRNNVKWIDKKLIDKNDDVQN